MEFDKKKRQRELVGDRDKQLKTADKRQQPSHFVNLSFVNHITMSFFAAEK